MLAGSTSSRSTLRHKTCQATIKVTHFTHTFNLVFFLRILHCKYYCLYSLFVMCSMEYISRTSVVYGGGGNWDIRNPPAPQIFLKGGKREKVEKNMPTPPLPLIYKRPYIFVYIRLVICRSCAVPDL